MLPTTAALGKNQNKTQILQNSFVKMNFTKFYKFYKTHLVTEYGAGLSRAVPLVVTSVGNCVCLLKDGRNIQPLNDTALLKLLCGRHKQDTQQYMKIGIFNCNGW